jgi:hypothetical protein
MSQRVNNAPLLKIAILGAGPSALFMFKRLLESSGNIEIDIFEKGNDIGAGMPYSAAGAGEEHITNVSGNEIPALVTPLSKWVRSLPKGTLSRFNIDPETFNEYKTLPRLLFGQYLTDQFKLLLQAGKAKGITTSIFLNCPVKDICDNPGDQKVTVFIDDNQEKEYDRIIICTGHIWPVKYEGRIPGYFESPYPPSKLAFIANHTVAIRGSSLTAIDAIRTLARANGMFEKDEDGIMSYTARQESTDFKIIMHSRNGLLPVLRFHLEDSHLGKQTIMSADEIKTVREANDGFLPLDYIFERNFKDGIRQHDPEFYEEIKHLQMESFVDLMMEIREKLDPFILMEAEYAEAEKSIKRRESIYWKEMLGVLSFTMNYPAKYFPAEDVLRLQKVLMPLIAVVIAYVPQSSAAEMLAMHKAGRLDIIAVGDDSQVEPGGNSGAIYRYTDESGQKKEACYQTFVDCTGQPQLAYEELPYKGLIAGGTVSPARLRFRDPLQGLQQLSEDNKQVHKDAKGDYYLTVPGVTINDSFQAVDKYNALNERVYIMAVPLIGGYNPDYSGLDFSDAASAAIVKALLD